MNCICDIVKARKWHNSLVLMLGTLRGLTKKLKTKRVYALHTRLNVAKIMPVSRAECDGRFSGMKLCVSPERASL